MAYITVADLESRYGADEILKLADRDGDGSPDTDLVTAAIEDACALADVHLAGRYDIPLNPVPALVARMVCAIARYHLYDDNPTERVMEEYRATIHTLEKIASGELMLIQAEGAGAAPEYSEGRAEFQDIEEY